MIKARHNIARQIAILGADSLLPPGYTEKKRRVRYTPDNCPHCEYDRSFPGFESGGWVQQENNGPIVSCPFCNPDGKHPREG